MATAISSVRISGLGREKLAALREQAKTFGLSAQAYALQLIEGGISLEQQARTKTFDELYAPVQSRFDQSGMNEADLDQLVTRARLRHRRSSTSKKG